MRYVASAVEVVAVEAVFQEEGAVSVSRKYYLHHCSPQQTSGSFQLVDNKVAHLKDNTSNLEGVVDNSSCTSQPLAKNVVEVGVGQIVVQEHLDRKYGDN